MIENLEDRIIYTIGEKKSDIKISIVTPVYKNDPSPLINALKQEINRKSLSCEIIIIDDGSADESLKQLMINLIKDINCYTKLIFLKKNSGRALARNNLINNSNGEYILFLDSDMLPDDKDFIEKWINYIDNSKPSIAFGGFTVEQIIVNENNKLAYYLAKQTDCVDAATRSAKGALSVATSNLLVKSEITKLVPFDTGFIGWGWEDVEWALRASKNNFPVTHIDNGATHLGLDEAEIILKKYRLAGPNFALILNKYSEMKLLNSTKLAYFISKFPFLKLIANIFGSIAISNIMPIKLRAFAARVYRAIFAAESLKS